MTLLQEAYTLMQGQSERNIRLIVELLQTMSPKKNAAVKASAEAFRRTGLAKGKVSLPDDFDQSFDEKENAPPRNDPFDRILIAQAKVENMIF